MKRLLIGLAFLAATTITAAAQTALQQRIENIISHSPALKGATVGVAVKNVNGKVLAEYNAGQRMVPASNLKLITTGTAMHTLGADYRFKTKIGYTGTIEDGTLNGDLYIIGGGDPTIGVEAPFVDWIVIVEKAGIRRINGRIIGDPRAWEGFLEFGDWTYEDIGTYYGTGSGALSFYKNSIDLNVAAGAEEGSPVQAEQSFPDTPWMHFTNSAFTGKEGTGNSLYLYTTDLAPYSELRGSFALDRAPKTEHFANKFGALTCAWHFRKQLNDYGIEVLGDAADIDRGGYIRTSDFILREKAGEPVVLGTSQSDKLEAIVKEINFESDNFYAEAIFRTMGEEATGYAVYDSARVAEKSALWKLGINPDDMALMDGSGLSRRNSVSARFIADFLGAMTASPAFPAFLASLPMPGEGTLATMLKNSPHKACFRLKSGSMEGVLCYSGYILGADGTPLASLSILVNGAVAKTGQIRRTLEVLLDAIAAYE
ncbi:MAG: D-alanyl-D-alanine carboxypeptidase/D-alanyl-D-alanine-endopeptidase [Bacteroidales bacterium]|nr:D-alanyl-D-alanine carboxypeptidase/D-alanyl-D-alanine-endopeptidase [Bacteroidales bacterium]MBO4585175.1 D-alanyl-D-alanine carboxypeptidase/D-alanyl-D-alanine-endopeptidase [Bacteroidales bacterium]